MVARLRSLHAVARADKVVTVVMAAAAAVAETVMSAVEILRKDLMVLAEPVATAVMAETVAMVVMAEMVEILPSISILQLQLMPEFSNTTRAVASADCGEATEQDKARAAAEMLIRTDKPGEMVTMEKWVKW